MRDPKALIIVILILVSGLSVGALAGYRWVLHSSWDEDAPPVNTTVVIAWPAHAEREPATAALTLQGFNATVYGATVQATERLGLELVVRYYQGMGQYVLQIGEFEADARCGWLYAVGPPDALDEGEQASDRTRLADGDVVSWRWGCV